MTMPASRKRSKEGAGVEAGLAEVSRMLLHPDHAANRSSPAHDSTVTSSYRERVFSDSVHVASAFRLPHHHHADAAKRRYERRSAEPELQPRRERVLSASEQTTPKHGHSRSSSPSAASSSSLSHSKRKRLLHCIERLTPHLSRKHRHQLELDGAPPTFHSAPVSRSGSPVGQRARHSLRLAGRSA